jgi:small GTP-binding protein
LTSRSSTPPPSAPPEAEIERLVSIALASAEVEDGHVAVAFVDADTIAKLNAEHRGTTGPTDVLSFPVDEAGPSAGPRELGDVVICAEHTEDLREAGHPRRAASRRDGSRDRRRRDAGPASGADELVSRAGFVALAGRPNVGKSTLVNALVGRKVAIVSDKPQTTRRAIRGVSTGEDTQLVLVDLPGVQRPRDALTERMQRRVEAELGESDAALLVINGEEGVGPGDRWIASQLERSPVPVVVAVNKLDRLDRGRTLEVLTGAAELGVGDDVFPISARTGSGVRRCTSTSRR